MSAVQASGEAPATGKERLFESATTLFSAQSYSEVGVAQIIERAGVQAPTLYHHFGDKEGLFTSWAKASFLRVGDAISKALKPDSSFTEQLVIFAETYLLHVDFDIRQVLHDSEGLARSESREGVLLAYYEALYEPLCTVLMRGISLQAIRQEPMSRMADTYLGALHALRRKPGHPLDLEPARWWGEHFAKALRL